MDRSHGLARPSGRRYDRVLPACQLCALMALMALVAAFTICFISYTDPLRYLAHWGGLDSGLGKGVRKPGCHGAPVPNEQVLMTRGGDEESVALRRELHVRSDDSAHGYAGQESEAELETGEAQLSARQFRLPKLPIPSEILDIPIQIPTHIKDIIPDLPIPSDVGDIVDDLPTDPGQLISDIPIPTLPPIPTIPTLPVPVPIPTNVPELPNRPIRTGPGTDVPHFPLPTILPPRDPRDPRDPPAKLPDLTHTPHRVLNLLHQSIAKLGTDPNAPKPMRDILRLILRFLNRLGGGHHAPNPGPPVPTKTGLPLPTRTRPHRQKNKTRADGSGGDGGGPLSDEQRGQLRAAVADEVWAGADWTNPLVAAATASLAMVTFDAVYLVAEAWEATDDESEKEGMENLFVVVDDGETGVVS